MTSLESQLEESFIKKLQELKYVYRDDIRDRKALEENFFKHFNALNHVRLTESERERLLEEIVTPDVFTAAKTLRTVNAFTRDDGTPLNYTLVNIDDWCKNTFEVVSQLRMNTDYSHHRYDVLLLINGVPVAQVELKTLGINPRRAIEQIVEYKNDPGNGYTRTLLCFVQLFIVSNRDSTYYFANNNPGHFQFNADERFLQIYEHAKPDNAKVSGLHDLAEAFLAKCTLGHTISRYMVLVATEQKLLMMRPYQFTAVKHRRLHQRQPRQRPHLAHQRLRQSAHQLQGQRAPQGRPEYRQVSLRRRPKTPRPPDQRGVQQAKRTTPQCFRLTRI